jgi:hypothetical protein
MSEDPLAVPTPRAHLDAEYDSIYAVLAETARGRRFLAEHARRSRPADIESSLAAITRIQAVLRVESAAQSLDRFRFDVLGIAQAIARAKAEIAAVKSDWTTDRAEEILALLNDLDNRINTLIDAWGEPPAEPAPIASFEEPAPKDIAGEQTAAPVDGRQDATLEDISRVMMALDPLFGGQHADAAAPEESTAETLFSEQADGPDPQAGKQQTPLSAPIVTAAPLSDDPLARLRALSDAEKIALFS